MGIDLMSVFKGDRTKVQPAPEVAAVVVFAQPDAERMEQVRQSIAAAGFTTDLTRKADDGETVVYGQGVTFEEGDPVMVRLSDQMLVTVKGIEPVQGLFGDMIAKNGFVPDLDMALDAFHEAVADTIQKSDQAPVEIAALTESLGGYLQIMASLPVAAYVAEAAVRKVAADPAGAEAAGTTEVPGLQAGDTVTEVQNADDANPDAVPAVPEPDPNATPQKLEPGEVRNPPSTVKEVKTPVQKTDLQPVLDALASMKTQTTTAIQHLTAKVDLVVAEQAAQKKTLDGVVQKTETLDGKLKTTVTAAPPTEDRVPDATSRVVKQDDDPRTGCFDTAYLRRRR